MTAFLVSVLVITGFVGVAVLVTVLIVGIYLYWSNRPTDAERARARAQQSLRERARVNARSYEQ